MYVLNIIYVILVLLKNHVLFTQDYQNLIPAFNKYSWFSIKRIYAYLILCFWHHQITSTKVDILLTLTLSDFYVPWQVDTW